MDARGARPVGASLLDHSHIALRHEPTQELDEELIVVDPDR